MRNDWIAALAVIIVILMFAVIYIPDIRPWFARGAEGTVTIGSAEVSGERRSRIVSLVATDAAGVTDGRYDTLQAPAGTDYQVPAGQTLITSSIDVGAGAAGVIVEAGYGDDAVNNSAAAPTTSVSLYEQTLGIAGGLAELNTYLEIPAGKFPWLRVTGAGAWRATAAGFTDP